MTPVEVEEFWEKEKKSGNYVGQVRGMHPRFCYPTMETQTFSSDWFVKRKNLSKAEYHGKYGLPADPDLVWRDRNEL